MSTPSFGSYPNPISTRGGGQIMPTQYWCPHQVLKDTGTPVMHSLHLRKNNALLVDRVLGMDSLSFREDVAAVAPDFLSSVHLKNSPPHNSLDSTDSNKSSARVQDDTDGLVFARASNGCLWLCKSYFLILSLFLQFVLVTLEAMILY